MSAWPVQAQEEAAPAVAERPLGPGEIADKWLDRLIKDQGDARALSMKLMGFNCCNELCGELNKIATDTEQLHKALSTKRRTVDPLTAENIQADVKPGPCFIARERGLHAETNSTSVEARFCLRGKRGSVSTTITPTAAWLRAC